MCDDVDLSYALGELQNTQTELEHHFGKQGVTNARLARLEAAVRLLTEGVYIPSPADSNPSEVIYGMARGRDALEQDLSEFHGK